MVENMKSLHKNSLWEWLPKPKEKKMIHLKLVYQKKRDVSFKARLVAKRFSQKERVGYVEIFSFVVKHILIHMLLALEVHNNMKLGQIDLKAAFLHLDLEKKYVSRPEGFAEAKK